MKLLKTSFFSILLLAIFLHGELKAEYYNLSSPNGKLRVQVLIEDNISWALFVNDTKVIVPSPVSLVIDGNKFPSKKPVIKNVVQQRVAEEVEDIVGVKSKYVENNCSELILDFESGISLVFRAYNNGCAYRFVTSYDKEITVNREEVTFNFGGDYSAYYPEEDGFVSHFERIYLKKKLNQLSTQKFCSLPALIEASNNIKIAITDAGQYDYPGMFLIGTGSNTLKGVFPKYVLEAKPAEEGPDRNEIIVKEADYLAKTNGRRALPWRCLMISDDDKQLLTNQLPFVLSDELKIDDTDWIKPGQVAWDWWNALNISGVDFESGSNTKTYKYYIDFASKFGIEYIILDEGWSKSSTNVMESNADIDLQELIKYGESKNVGIILWTLWKPLNENLIQVLDLYQKLGVKGIKVDFMQRADQWMVNFHERVLSEAAKRHLLVDFHGAFKPSGMRRPYPNFISNEGVKGLENCKWSKVITPEHDATLPFTRMLAGPMDYTPGATYNANEADFQISFSRPMSMGTRCHQVALYIVYESPLQMLADSPTNYLKEEETTRFISEIPTTWDETKVIDAKVSDYVLIARRNGEKWYIGAITDWDSRELDLDLSFIGNGLFTLEYMQDGVNAEKIGNDYIRSSREVTKTDIIKLKLAKGGGWAGIISRKNQ